MMGPVLCKLTNLIEQKFTDLKNVRKKMELLRKELIAINLVLEKHAVMGSPDAQAKAWVAEMHELAYDIEDNIDLFTLHVDHEPPDTTTGVKRFFLKLIRKVKNYSITTSLLRISKNFMILLTTDIDIERDTRLMRAVLASRTLRSILGYRHSTWRWKNHWHRGPKPGDLWFTGSRKPIGATEGCLPLLGLEVQARLCLLNRCMRKSRANSLVQLLCMYRKIPT
jgi:hypothetical protein